MLGCALSVSADVAFSDVAPTTHILATTTLGSIDTSLFPLTGTAPAPIAGNDNHARGQLFSLGEGTGSAFQITAIVLQKNVAATFASDLLTLRIFQGTEEEWVTGTGHLATDTNFYNGTGVTPLYDEAFTLDGLIDDNEFVTLELATPLTVRKRADFGFFLTYDPSSGTSPDRFRHLETSEGGRLSVTTSSHVTSSRSMNFFVLGEAIEGGLVTTSATAPASEIIVSSSGGGVDTALFDEDANANHARGQLFALPNGPGLEYEVTSLTLKKSTAQTFLNDRITLHLFEGMEAQWSSGTGHTTAANGSDYYSGATVVPLHREVFTLNGTYQDGDFITFQLGTPILVKEDSDFGFFLTYDQAGVASPDRFRHLESGTGGGRLSISTGSHSATSVDSRKVLYYLQGTPVGEGASLTLGSPFQDRMMILQRGKPVLVWGKADPASSVTVSINGVSAIATTDAAGDWEAEVPTVPAGGPYLLEVTSGSQSESISDVLVGDVWLCFGQSNMVYTLNQMAAWHTAYENEIIANDNIRCLKIDQDASLNEEDEAGMSWLANSTAGT